MIERLLLVSRWSASQRPISSVPNCNIVKRGYELFHMVSLLVGEKSLGGVEGSLRFDEHVDHLDGNQSYHSFRKNVCCAAESQQLKVTDRR